MIVKCRRLRWAGHVARMRKTRNAYRILVEDNIFNLKVIKTIADIFIRFHMQHWSTIKMNI
jgi:hypothetical protein